MFIKTFNRNSQVVQFVRRWGMEWHSDPLPADICSFTQRFIVALFKFTLIGAIATYSAFSIVVCLPLIYFLGHDQNSIFAVGQIIGSIELSVAAIIAVVGGFIWVKEEGLPMVANKYFPLKEGEKSTPKDPSPLAEMLHAFHDKTCFRIQYTDATDGRPDDEEQYP